MLSSSRRLLLGLALLVCLTAPAARASAQQAQGFAVERFYPAPAGAGWFVMDDLDMHGGLGGALALTTGYAENPLRLEDAIQRLAVVSSESFINFGLAATYDRWRVYLDLRMPLLIAGHSGTIGGAIYTSPQTMLTASPPTSSGRVTLASNPDTLSDPRVGVEGRLFGAPGGRLRLGLSAELIAPNGERNAYDTDGTFRAMIRALAAGDLGRLRYAGQLGVHIRPLDEASIPGAPQGSELLFGAAGGAKVGACGHGTMAIIVGPELYGATAFRSFFGSTTTAFEGLLTGRLEGTGDQGRQLRVKLGAGAGINQDFGAPEWRILLAIEAFGNVAGASAGGAGRVQF
jgi:OOP family OmpA-OmpF porin